MRNKLINGVRLIHVMESVERSHWCDYRYQFTFWLIVIGLSAILHIAICKVFSGLYYIAAISNKERMKDQGQCTKVQQQPECSPVTRRLQIHFKGLFVVDNGTKQ